MLKKIWFTPSFSTLIENRAEGFAIVGSVALLAGLHWLGLPGWACPLKSLTGIPCPGCGLTTATSQLLSGQFLASLDTHAFAGIILAAYFLMVVVLALPKVQRQYTVTWIAKFEQRTGITSFVLIALMLYWIFRLAGFF
jgi:hypothetical protein